MKLRKQFVCKHSCILISYHFLQFYLKSDSDQDTNGSEIWLNSSVFPQTHFLTPTCSSCENLAIFALVISVFALFIRSPQFHNGANPTLALRFLAALAQKAPMKPTYVYNGA